MLPIILGAIGAVVTALVTYLVARRTTSGRIETSDAEMLWAEATRMREDLRKEAEAMRAEMLSLREEAGNLRSEVRRLRASATRMSAELTDAKTEATTLRHRIGEMTAELDILRRRGRES